jgi:phosphotriesterase-related protein
MSLMIKEINRRSFLAIFLGALFIGAREKKHIITVNGAIDSSSLGLTLIHEHFLVDFIGAEKINFKRWDRNEVIQKVLPFIDEAKKAGVKTIFDCTPAYLGRDAVLLKELSRQSGIQIITNTGYYGALNNKHLPSHAFSETAEQLADRWTGEYNNGIDGTGVKPGFMKIGVDSNEKLSEIHQKLVRAAAITHLKTGLTICSHTGPGKTAFEQIDILKKFGVSPDAFVWVHAQAEKDKSYYTRAASLGAWVSLDGIGWGDFNNYMDSLEMLKSNKLLNRVLISHDAGWYKPEDPEGEFKGYTNIFKELIPGLKENGFSKKDFDQLLVKNPIEAFSIRIRKEKI